MIREMTGRMWRHYGIWAGLKDVAPVAEKGFSMLTAAPKKKMDVQRAVEKKNAAALARREVAEVRKKSEERTLPLRRPAASQERREKQVRRPVRSG